MSFKARTSIELKVQNINKLIKRVSRREITPREAEINRRLEKLKAESDVGVIWAEDLGKKYISVVKNLNKEF